MAVLPKNFHVKYKIICTKHTVESWAGQDDLVADYGLDN
jgi:hypothetical protein